MLPLRHASHTDWHTSPRGPSIDSSSVSKVASAFRRHVAEQHAVRSVRLGWHARCTWCFKRVPLLQAFEARLTALETQCASQFERSTSASSTTQAVSASSDALCSMLPRVEALEALVAKVGPCAAPGSRVALTLGPTQAGEQSAHERTKEGCDATAIPEHTGMEISKRVSGVVHDVKELARQVVTLSVRDALAKTRPFP